MLDFLMIGIVLGVAIVVWRMRPKRDEWGERAIAHKEAREERGLN